MKLSGNYIFGFLIFAMAIKSYSQEGNCLKPDICDRECWDSSGNHPKNSSPKFTSPKYFIVHHTPLQNGTNYEQTIRNIWNFHVLTNGWDDIGYNWLIDPNGKIYEGAGDGIHGNHFSCMNTNTIGIALIGGDFNVIEPTEAAIKSLNELIAWKSTEENINISESSLHNSSQLTLNHISGHRDGNQSSKGCPKGTSCPGEKLYEKIRSGSLRNEISDFPCYSSPCSNFNSCLTSSPFEPNNSMSQATGILDIGKCFSQTAQFCESIDLSQSDEDYYFINVNTSGKLDVIFDSNNILYVDLLDATGNIIKSGISQPNGHKTIQWNGDGIDICLGVYLRVSSYSSGNDCREYSLKVEWESNSSCPADSNFSARGFNNNDINISGKTNVCEGESTTLTASGGSGNYVWYLNGSEYSTSNPISVNNFQNGVNEVVVLDNDNPCFTGAVNINQVSEVIANAGQNQTIAQGESVTLQGSGGSNYKWSPSNGLSNSNIFNPIASPSQTTEYTLTVTENDCSDTDTVTVYVDNVSTGNPPENDNCGNAITLTSNTNESWVNGTVKDATSSGLGPNQCIGCNCTSEDDYDVFYKFTAVSNSHTVHLNDLASNFDAVIELREGCSLGTNIKCVDPTGVVTPMSLDYDDLNIGQTYFIRVFEYDFIKSPPTSPTFKIAVTHEENQPSDGVDLVTQITDVSNDNPDAGDQITIDYKMSNKGDTPTQNIPFLSFYLSSNNTFSNNDSFLGLGETINGLSANETLTFSTSFELPNADDDQYYLLAIIDNANSVAESNEDNNLDSYTIYIGEFEEDGPDLNVKDIEVSKSSGLAPGEEITIEVKIENEGNEDAKDSSRALVFLDIDNDEEYDDDNEFMKDISFGKFDAGEKKTKTKPVNLPSNIPSVGNYNIIVLADYEGDVTEINEKNNDKTQGISFSTTSVAAPDLVPSFIKWEIEGTTTEINSFDLCLEQEYRLYWNITNSGNTDANDSFKSRAVISKDEYYDGSDISFDTSSKLSLNVGEIDENNDDRTWRGIGIGDYYLLIIADEDGDLAESNENNNIIAIPIRFSNCNNSLYPDLAIEIANYSPYSTKLGDYINVNLKITNIGDAPVNDDFNVKLFLSEDEVFHGSSGSDTFNDHILRNDASIKVSDAIAPNEFIELTMRAHTQNGTGIQEQLQDIGIHYLFVAVDADKDIDVENDRTNNIDYVPIELTSLDCYFNAELNASAFEIYPWQQQNYYSAIDIRTEDECSWIATANKEWINILNGNGNGNSYASFELEENLYPFDRSGIIYINNEEFYSITQEARPCESLGEGVKIAIGSNPVITNLNCDVNGSIDIQPLNGFLPYTYEWSNGSTTEDLTNITETGEYTITVTDSAGCIVSSTFTISESSEIDTSISQNDNTLIANQEGSNYQWIDCNSNLPITGEISSSFTPSSNGNYAVEITFGNCIEQSECITISDIIDEQPPLNISSFLVSDIYCLQNGLIDIEVSDGYPPYSYTWSNGTSEQDLTDIVDGGDFTVMVTDSQGNMVQQTFSVDFIVTIDNTLTVNGNEIRAIQDNAIYQWRDCATNLPIEGATEQSFTPVVDGSYSVEIILENCFIYSACATISNLDNEEPEEPSLYISSYSVLDIDCLQQGFIDINVQDGYAPYTYTWSNGSTSQDLDQISQPGDYAVTITDSEGNDFEQTFTINSTGDINTNISWDGIELWANQPDASYRWINCNSNSSVNVFDKTFRPTENGSYAVEITYGNCTEISDCIIISDIESTDKNLADAIKVYPNPVKNILNIDLGEPYKESRVFIYNVEGREVGKLFFENQQALEITIANLPTGLYFVHIYLDSDIKIEKDIRILK